MPASLLVARVLPAAAVVLRALEDVLEDAVVGLVVVRAVVTVVVRGDVVEHRRVMDLVARRAVVVEHLRVMATRVLVRGRAVVEHTGAETSERASLHLLRGRRAEAGLAGDGRDDPRQFAVIQHDDAIARAAIHRLTAFLVLLHGRAAIWAVPLMLRHVLLPCLLDSGARQDYIIISTI